MLTNRDLMAHFSEARPQMQCQTPQKLSRTELLYEEALVAGVILGFGDVPWLRPLSCTVALPQKRATDTKWLYNHMAV